MVDFLFQECRCNSISPWFKCAYHPSYFRLITDLFRQFPFSLWPVNAVRFGYPCHSKVTSSPADLGKWTLYSTIRVSFPDRVYWWSGSLTDSTLLADWLPMILISLAPSDTSSIHWHQSLQETVWHFTSLYCNRWGLSCMVPSHLFF